jgi:hypothetical protein
MALHAPRPEPFLFQPAPANRQEHETQKQLDARRQARVVALACVEGRLGPGVQNEHGPGRCDCAEVLAR